MYATPPESRVVGAVTGVGFKSIAPIISLQSVFEVGTKFTFSLSLIYCVMPFMLFPGF